MFAKKSVITAIFREKVIAAEVVLGGKLKIAKYFEYGWNDETMDIVFGQIKKDLKTKKIRVLLSDNLAYVIRIIIPDNIKGREKREYIASEIKKHIPEELDDSQWDYKELGFSDLQEESDLRFKEVIVFSPVKQFQNVLNSAVLKSDIIVEAIEPEEISKTRDPNPFFGLAKKDDVKGRDEKVLNIKIDKKSDEDENGDELLLTQADKDIGNDNRNTIASSEDTINTPRRLKLNYSILVLIIFFLLSLIGAFLLRDKIYQMFGIVISEDNREDYAQTLDLDSQPTQPELNLSEYKIQILNGSGIDGEAEFAKSVLEKEGFMIESFSLAERSDYERTEIKIKKHLPEELFNRIDRVLDNYYEIENQSTVLDDTSQYDAVIIIPKRIDN